MTTKLLTAAIVAVVIAVSGCGGGGSSDLSAADAATVASFQANAGLVAGGSDRWYADLLDSMDATIDIARKNPKAVYTTGDGTTLTMEQVLSDGASTLQSEAPELSSELDRAAASLE